VTTPSAGLSVRAYQVRRDGRLGDVTAPLESWVAKQPDDFSVQAVLAEAYARGGQLLRARDKYEFIVEHVSANAVILNNLAWLYHETRDDRALGTAERAYRLMPTNVAIADTYGWILVERGKVAEGLAILRSAEANGGAEVKYHYAAALARSGDRLAARQRLERLLAGNEEFDSQGDARRLLQELANP
jgi:Tfp pilus assembly protein PilF